MRSGYSSLLALALCLAPQSHAQDKLAVTGTRQIKHFDVLAVDDGGRLASGDLIPARVKPMGGVEMARNFNSSMIAGARVTYKGQDVGKINAAGSSVLTLAGLPVLPNWVKSLSKPAKPAKPATQVPHPNQSMAEGMMSGEKGGVEAGGGKGADLQMSDFVFTLGGKKIENGSIVQLPFGKLTTNYRFKVTCPGAKRPVNVTPLISFQARDSSTTQKTIAVGGSESWDVVGEWTPKRPGQTKVHLMIKLPMINDASRLNNKVVINAVVVLVP